MHNEPDERMHELEITLLADGGVELKQGSVEDYCASVILHPCHLDFLAKLTGYMAADEVAHEVKRACGRLQDRLQMAGGLLNVYTKDDERLSSALEAIIGPQENARLTSFGRTATATSVDLSPATPLDATLTTRKQATGPAA